MSEIKDVKRSLLAMTVVALGGGGEVEGGLILI